MDQPRIRVIVNHVVKAERPLTGPLTIGRLPDNGLVLDDALVSGHHGRLEPEGTLWRYTDLGGVNGSVVAAGPVLRAGQSVLLTEDCQILLGNTVLDMYLGGTAAEQSPLADTDADDTTVAAARGPAPAAAAAARSPTAAAAAPAAVPSAAGGPALTLAAARPRVLVVLDGNVTTVPLQQARAVIGRGAGCDVRIDHASVSARHAEIALQDGRFTVRDLGSTNGTLLDLQRLAGARPLRSGAHLIVGDADLLFVHDGGLPGAGTADAAALQRLRIAEDERALGLLLKERRIGRAEARELQAELQRGERQLGELLVARGRLSPGEWVELEARGKSDSTASSVSHARGEPLPGPGPRRPALGAGKVLLALAAILALGALALWLARGGGAGA